MSLSLSPSTFEAFSSAVRCRESGDNYAAKNSLGYLGAYQFGMARLCDLGLTDRIPGTRGYGNASFWWRDPWTEDRFLSEPSSQDECFREHVKRLLQWIDRKGFSRFIGEQTSAIVAGELDPADDSIITLTGMIAVAHLLGPGGLRDLLRRGLNLADANGTRASDYMRHFADIGG